MVMTTSISTRVNPAWPRVVSARLRFLLAVKKMPTPFEHLDPILVSSRPVG